MQILSDSVISFGKLGPVTTHLIWMLMNADFICWSDQFWYSRVCNCPSRLDVEGGQKWGKIKNSPPVTFSP